MSCFICLESTDAQHFSWILGNLKRLVVTTSQLLKLEGILDEDWDFLEGSQCSVCCLKCYENLETILRTHEILVKTKEKLKECLDRVETAVGNSVKPEVDEVASLWGPGCFKFRLQLKIRNPDPFLHNDYNPLEEVGERLCDPLGDLMSGVESTQDPLGQTKGRRKRRNIVVIAEEDNLDDHKLPLTIKRRKSWTESCIGDEDWPEGACESEGDVDRESDFDLPMSSGNDDEEDVKKTNERDKDLCQRTTFGVDCCKLQSKHAFSHRHKIGIHGTKPYKCDLCSKTLRGRQTLQRHRARFHGNKPVPKSERSWDCDMCRETVMDTNIRQHVENHVGDYFTPCPKPSCPLVFCTLKYLNLHVASAKSCGTFYNKDSSNTCQICGFVATNITTLHSHLLSVHEAEGFPKTLPCPVSPCPEVFAHRQSVIAHISKTHALPTNLHLSLQGSSQNCPTCRQLHPHAEIAEHFITAHAVSQDSIVSCSECPYKAPSRLDLLNHLLVHFRAGGKVRISCDLCSKGFTALGVLRRHYLSEHQIGELFVCEFCPSSYPLQRTLKEHITKRHSKSARRSNPSKSFACDECSRQDSSQAPPCFPSEAKLIEHKITSHDRDPYKCDTCGKTFLALKNLQTHVRTVHKKIIILPKFPCDLPGCSTICGSAEALRKHKISVKHVGKTNAAKCDQCSSAFNTWDQLKAHKRYTHAQARPFVCDQCGKAFVKKDKLENHSRTHTGEKPFVCPTCQKGFTFKRPLDYHLKHVHPQT